MSEFERKQVPKPGTAVGATEGGLQQPAGDEAPILDQQENQRPIKGGNPSGQTQAGMQDQRQPKKPLIS